MRGPALGVLEIATIARGIVSADAGLKRSPAILLHSRAVSGGKHLVFFEGGVAEVEESLGAARLAAGDLKLDEVFLSAADPQVWPMLGAPVTITAGAVTVTGDGTLDFAGGGSLAIARGKPTARTTVHFR